MEVALTVPFLTPVANLKDAPGWRCNDRQAETHNEKTPE